MDCNTRAVRALCIPVRRSAGSPPARAYRGRSPHWKVGVHAHDSHPPSHAPLPLNGRPLWAPNGMRRTVVAQIQPSIICARPLQRVAESVRPMRHTNGTGAMQRTTVAQPPHGDARCHTLVLFELVQGKSVSASVINRSRNFGNNGGRRRSPDASPRMMAARGVSSPGTVASTRTCNV